VRVLRFRHAGRYVEISKVLAKYGFADLIEHSGLNRILPRVHNLPETIADREGSRPLHLRLALQELGPTFIKLGQIMSTRAEMLPAEYIEELANLQDNVPPFPEEEAKAIVSEELGVPIEQVFREFSPKPIASASLAQVHEAVTRGGRQVALKIQRPGIKDVIAKDLSVLRQLAEWAQHNTEYGRIYDLPGVVDELERAITEELDFNLERRRMEAIGRNIKEFSRIRVPRVYRKLSGRRLITMELVRGVKIGEIGTIKVDRPELAEQFLHAYLKQMVVDGLFHADPHPGNILVEPSGKIVLLDFGMVGLIDNELRRDILRLLIAFSEQKSSEVAELILRIGQPSDRFDLRGFKGAIAAMLGRYYDAPIEEIALGDLTVETVKVALRFGVKTPASLSLLGKTLLYIDTISKTIDPAANPFRILRSYVQRLVLEEVRTLFSPSNLTKAFIEGNELVLTLPGHIRQIVEKIAEDHLRVEIEPVGLEPLYETISKTVNRLAFAVVVAAILISSSLVFRANAGPQVFGLSAFAIFGFFVAVVLGLYLIYTILRSRLL
jgi:ubiquinone biosynthesis protein